MTPVLSIFTPPFKISYTPSLLLCPTPFSVVRNIPNQRLVGMIIVNAYHIVHNRTLITFLFLLTYEHLHTRPHIAVVLSDQIQVDTCKWVDGQASARTHTHRAKIMGTFLHLFVVTVPNLTTLMYV